MRSDPPRPEPRARNRAAKRQAFVDVARSIIDTEGIDGLTMQRVATELDCGVGSIYRYFSSKDALVAAAHREQLDELRDALAGSETGSGAAAALDARAAALAAALVVGRRWIDAIDALPAEVRTARRLAVLPATRAATAEVVALLRAPLDDAVAVGALDPGDNTARVQVLLVGVVDAVTVAAPVHGLELFGCLLVAWGADPPVLARAAAALEVEGS
jgi:AcrR family transcriptional regulator